MIKAGLSSRLLDKRLEPIIHGAVEYVSLAFHRGSHVLNYIVTRCCERDEPIPNILDAGAFIDAVVRGDTEKNSHVRIAHEEAFGDWPIPVRPKVYGSPTAQLFRSTYLTAVTNSCWIPFESRLKRYVRSWAASTAQTKLPARRLRTICDCIRGWSTSVRKLEVLTPGDVQLIFAERVMLGLDAHILSGSDLAAILDQEEDAQTQLVSPFGAERVSDPWLKQTTGLILKTYHRWLTTVQREQVAKSWSLVPLMKLRKHHIHIDSKVLFHMMKAAEILEGKLKFEAFQELATSHFRSMFRDSGMGNPSRYEVAKHVATDGVFAEHTFQAICS